MLYMLIGRFRHGHESSGTPLADGAARTESAGLKHVGSWVEATLGRSFHVVECENLAVLQQWAARWRHCVELELVPIVPTRDAVSALEPLLEN